MDDFTVSMSPDELPDEMLREAVARALRGAEGQALDPFAIRLTLEVSWIDLDELAVGYVPIVTGAWDDEEDVNGLIAFDLGTGEKFVVHLDPLGRAELAAVTRADEQDAMFRQLARGWVWRNGWADGRFPTTLYSSYKGEPWLARELTMALRGNEAALADLLASCGVADDADPAEAMEHWDHAVMVDGGAPVIDLFEWDARGEDGAFAAWLDDVAVAWDDTGAAVSPEDALRLWLVCQYLALV